MATLATIGGIASAMGPAVEKSSKGILSDVLKCLGDNKKHMRESTMNALDSWVAAVQLDKMVPYITAALVDAKLGAEGRKDLFDWLSKHLSGINDSSDAVHLLKPTAAALMDKSGEVRKAAEACFGEILRVCGQEAVTKNLKDLRGPALQLVVERLRPSLALQEAVESTKLASTGLTSKAISKGGKSGANDFDRASKHGSRAVPSRGIQAKVGRPGSVLSVHDIAVQSQALFNIKDSNKDDRERLVVRRHKFEEPRVEQIQDLEGDLLRYFKEDPHRRLLSTDFKKQIDGLELLQKALPASSKVRKELGTWVMRATMMMKWNRNSLLVIVTFP